MTKTLCCRDYDPPGLWCRACRAGDPANCTDRMTLRPAPTTPPAAPTDDTLRGVRQRLAGVPAITLVLALFVAFSITDAFLTVVDFAVADRHRAGVHVLALTADLIIVVCLLAARQIQRRRTRRSVTP